MAHKVKLTTLIVILVISAIAVPILTVSGAIYFSLRNEAVAASKNQQVSNLGASGTSLESRVSGATRAA